MPALKMLDMATPASTRVIRAAPARSAISSTSSTPASAPRKAAMGVRRTASGARAQHRAVASPAPELTPITLGAARGLFSTPWMMTPAQAKAAPASRQPHSRGRRT